MDQTIINLYDRFTHGFISRREFLDRLTGMHTHREEHHWLTLKDAAPGRLLDVGCGNGRFLAKMRAAGWQVEGTDFDPAAVKHVREQLGVPAHCGDLESAGFPAGSFDVVVLQHVIEHVETPVDLLRECLRILKPGGQLLLITPNVESWGHRRFGPFWRGLEPPRHLCLYSKQTLAELARRAGFQVRRAFTSAAGAEFILADRLAIEHRIRRPPLPLGDRLVVARHRVGARQDAGRSGAVYAAGGRSRPSGSGNIANFSASPAIPTAAKR